MGANNYQRIKNNRTSTLEQTTAESAEGGGGLECIVPIESST